MDEILISEKNEGMIGHNSGDMDVTVEVRLFNSLHKFSKARLDGDKMSFPAGSTVGDIVDAFGIPLKEIFLVMRNGRDITPGCIGQVINRDVVLDDGDVIALSGPVPYSWGYGAPVV